MTTEDIYMAVQNLLTIEEQSKFLGVLSKLNPHFRGAPFTDVLSILDDGDACLSLVEPAYAQLREKVKRPNLIGPVAIVVAHIHGHGDEEHPARTVIMIGEVKQILER